MRAIYTRYKKDGQWTPYRNISKKGVRNSHETGPFFINVLIPDGNGGKKPKWYPLKGATDVEQAKKLADAYDATQTAIGQGVAVVDSSDGTTPVEIAVAQFIRAHRNDRPKTVKQYKTALGFEAGETSPKGLLQFVAKGSTVKMLATDSVMDGVLQKFEAAGYSKKTIHTRMGVVFSLLKKFKKETGVEYAANLVLVAKPVSKRPKAYSDTEIDTLWKRMTKEADVLYSFFLSTGCREQEVQYATWADIDFDNQTYRVTGDGKEDVGFVPKNHEERDTWLTTELCDALSKRKKAAGPKARWIFPNRDGNPNGHMLRPFKSIAKKAGLNCGLCKKMITTGRYRTQGSEGTPKQVSCANGPYCRFHKLHRLRKTAATRWLRGGFDLETIRVRLGHKNLSITQIYLEDEMKTSKETQARFDTAMKINRQAAD